MAPRLLYLSLLCLAISITISTTTAAAAASAPPTITSIAPRRVSLDTSNITVVGTNLRNAAPGAAAEVAVGRRPYVTEAAGSLLLRTDASAMAGASLSVTAADPFATNRNLTATNLLQRYNTSMSLLAGAHAGGHGFQPNGYSIIDENYLAAKVLQPYDPSTAAAMSASAADWLAKPSAAGWKQDRRENLWGVRTCAVTTSGECSVLGSYTPDPPLAGTNVLNSPFVVYSELNNNSTFTVDKCVHATGLNINHCVPLLLALHLGGNTSAASQIFKQLLSTWDGIGFGPPKPPHSSLPGTDGGEGGRGLVVGRCQTRVDALYTTRSFGYFLLAQRATHGWPGFEVPAATVAAMEAALWKLQGCDPGGGGLPASYNSRGEPCCQGAPALSSIETGALSLLPYDARVRTSWFPPPPVS